MENKNTVSVIYQKVDENGRLAGYEKDYNNIAFGNQHWSKGTKFWTTLY